MSNGSPPAVDISALKARAKEQAAPKGEVTPVAEEAYKRKTSPAEVSKFVKEFDAINAAGDEVDPATAALEKAAEDALALELADQVRYRNTPSDNREVRLAVEARCRAMDFGDLVLSGRVTQSVPVLPGKLEPTYQSLVGKEVFWLERSAHVYGGATNMAVASWLGYARLAMSLTELNGRDLGTHLDAKDGSVVDDKVTAKIAALLDMPERLLEVLLINYTWFSARVEDLYRHDFKLLKNG